LKFIVMGFRLPTGSVVTTGNGTMSYEEYRRGRQRQPTSGPSPLVTYRPRSAHGRQLSSVLWKDRLGHRDIRLGLQLLTGSSAELTGPVNRGEKIYLRVDVDRPDRPIVQRQAYEIVVYVDHRFVAEDENGRLPFNWPLTTEGLAAGKHVVTVNVHTVGGEIGTASRAFELALPKQ